MLDPGDAFPEHRDFGDDPWVLRTHGLQAEHAAVDETLFALGNGYLGLRAHHGEGLPLGEHGTFLNGLHETWAIRHAEGAYGFAEQGQTIVNAPDGKTIRIFVDDERLTLTTAELHDVTRSLDLRTGVLSRSLVWLTPSGKRVRIDTRRGVSFTHRHLARIELEITVLNADADVSITSLLLNRQDLVRERPEPAPAGLSDPRRAETMPGRVLLPALSEQEGARSILSYSVANSGMTVAAGADHSFECADRWHRNSADITGDRAKHVFHVHATQGRTIRLTKTLAYHSSVHGGPPELIDRCGQSLDLAARLGEDFWAQQESWLAEFWQRSDVRIDAEAGVQQAVRWNLFQLAQASARADGKGIAAKGVTGSGYGGHYFWDTEIYVLPFLSVTNPRWARNALRFRQLMLPAARKRAAMLNEEGALFPWRTINGEEASAYYAAGTAQYHINADITLAIARYVRATGDAEFLREGAADIVIETARLWMSLGFWEHDRHGEERFHIHGVTGPDEYTTVVNDNLFTNVMARFNLRYAHRVLTEMRGDHPIEAARLCERLGIHDTEPGEWLHAAEGMTIPYSAEAGVHPQDAHFLEREVWDLANTPPEQKPLLLHFHPLVIYRFQVLKQADVVLAMFLQGGEFTPEQKRANFEYYDALTTGDSSLSAAVQSAIATEVGYHELGYRYFEQALRVDLDDRHRNTADGVHVASAGGVWLAIVHGFGGLREDGDRLSFDPKLPAHWSSLTYRMSWRGSDVEVRLETGALIISASPESQPVDGSFRCTVRGEEISLAPGSSRIVPLPDQGQTHGVFAGVSAGMLPREGETGSLGPASASIPLVTTTIPVLDPGDRG